MAHVNFNDVSPVRSRTTTRLGMTTALTKHEQVVTRVTMQGVIHTTSGTGTAIVMSLDGAIIA